MPIKLEVKSNKLPQIAGKMRTEASKILRETAFAIQANVLEGMSAAHGGRLYTSGSVVHQASAPGEMPAIDESALFNSIAVDAEPNSLEAIVYTGMEYAPHLEYGTVTMQARPFMEPATEAERAKFERRFADLEAGLH